MASDLGLCFVRGSGFSRLEFRLCSSYGGFGAHGVKGGLMSLIWARKLSWGADSNACAEVYCGLTKRAGCNEHRQQLTSRAPSGMILSSQRYVLVFCCLSFPSSTDGSKLPYFRDLPGGDGVGQPFGSLRGRRQGVAAGWECLPQPRRPAPRPVKSRSRRACHRHPSRTAAALGRPTHSPRSVRYSSKQTESIAFLGFIDPTVNRDSL